MSKYLCGCLAACLLLGAGGVARANAEADVKAIVDKAIKAVGGEAKVKKLKGITLKAKGTLEAGGAKVTFTVEGSVEGFDKVRVEMNADFNGMAKGVVLVVNGDKGWAKDTGENKTKEAPKDGLKLVKAELYALRLVQQLAPLKDKACTLSALGEVQINEKPALGVKAARKGFPDVDVFFEKKSGLPVKCQLSVMEMQGGMEVTHEFYFNEPKEMGGIKHFSKVIFHRDGKKAFEIEIAEVQAEAKLDADLFKKPD